MDKNAAKALVKETFQNPFDKDRFYRFTKELLNHFEDAHFIYRGNLIPDAYDPFIQTLERLGKYQDPDGNKIDILIIKLKKESSLEHARTMQRNFVAWYLGGSRGDILKDAALVAFVAPDPQDWRFSLVKMEYKITETPSGKVKTKEEFTPAKRYSFIVGQNETTHTAQSRLVPILEDDAHDPTLERLGEAFNIERVTEEFFEKYRELYLKVKETIDALVEKDAAIKKDFETKAVNTVDFSKKLLGQIVFLYFLQKKGWFGVKRGETWGSGSKNFLRELFEKKHGDYKNFFNDVLEPLFYEALRIERPKDYYDQFDCRIPFLNGGLFDPINDYDWQETDLFLSNEIFSNKIRDEKTGDIGTGILDIFDRYNFTVKEDEPLEKEVAVDPEMLGKVFENLLEVKDRRSKGTFYTPREIVHYMCQESLVNYLATELEGKVSKEDIGTLIKYGETAIEHDATYIEKKSKNEKTKTYGKAKLPKSIEKNAELIDEKLETIRVCDPAVGSGAFPVGMMNEIIRTRNALTPYLGKDGERTPYNFKRHAIQNSLYGVDIDPGAIEIAKLRLWLSLVVDEEDIKQIKPLPNLDYKIIQGNSLLSVEKAGLFVPHWMQDLEKVKRLFFNETNARKKQEYQKQINELVSQITSGHREFDFEVYFSEVFRDGESKGFDVVIANPPYVRKENLDKKTIKELEEHFTEEANGKLRHWSDDLYVHFIFQGITITKPRGTVTYITNDSFIGLTSKRRVRRLLLQYDLARLIRCPRETFEAMIYTAVFLLRKNESKNKEYESGYFSYPSFQYNALGSIPYKVVSALPDERLIFANPILKIYEKLTGLDKVKQFLNVLDTGIHSGNVREKIFFKEKNKEGLYRLLQGKQIERWGIFWDRPEAKYKYCDINYEPKRQKGVGRKGRQSKHEEYWHFCGEIENHYQPERLLMRQSDDDLIVAHQSEKEIGRFYTDNTLFTVLPKDKKVSLKYAMALFNSKLLNAIYHLLSQEEGKTLAQVKTGLVDELPFVVENQKSIIGLTEKILAVTKDNDYLENNTKQAKVRDYEKQIDQLVYKLYGLTPDEIKIVENGKKT